MFIRHPWIKEDNGCMFYWSASERISMIYSSWHKFYFSIDSCKVWGDAVCAIHSPLNSLLSNNKKMHFTTLKKKKERDRDIEGCECPSPSDWHFNKIPLYFTNVQDLRTVKGEFTRDYISYNGCKLSNCALTYSPVALPTVGNLQQMGNLWSWYDNCSADRPAETLWNYLLKPI